MANKLTTITFKRGDTFLLTCVYHVNGDPAPLPMTGAVPNIRSQIRTREQEKVADLGVSVISEQGGVFALQCLHTATREWAIGKLYCDIEYTSTSGVVFSTETFIIDVVPDYTYSGDPREA